MHRARRQAEGEGQRILGILGRGSARARSGKRGKGRHLTRMRGLRRRGVSADFCLRPELIVNRAPAQHTDHAGKALLQRGVNRQRAPIPRMPQLNAGASQQQAPAAETLPEEAVVDSLAPGGVADDGVGDVLQVAAQLMLAAGRRGEAHQRVARGRVAVDGLGQFDGGEATVSGDGVQRFGRAVGAELAAVVIEPARQRMVDDTGFGRPAAHHGEVALVHLVALKLPADLARAGGVEGEQQHARGALVEPVQRMHAPPDLVAQQLHGKARFVAVDVAAMDQQAGGFVDGDEAVVAVEDVEHVAQVEE